MDNDEIVPMGGRAFILFVMIVILFIIFGTLIWIFLTQPIT